MNGWMNRLRVDGWMDRRTVERIADRSDVIDQLTEAWTDRRTDEGTDGIVGRMDT